MLLCQGDWWLKKMNEEPSTMGTMPSKRLFTGLSLCFQKFVSGAS
jgi:hypothetical protein